MINKYLGVLDPAKLVNLNFKQTDKLLFDKGLMIESYSESDLKLMPTKDIGAVKIRLEISERTLKYLYLDDIAKSVFEFLLDHYKTSIGGDKALFNRDFDNKTFGLTESEKRTKGLAYFNSYFDIVKGDNQIGMMYNSEGDIVAEKRFKTLLRIRESFKHELQKPNDLVLAILFGHLDYFNRELFESNIFLVNLFKFENILSILINLNAKFKFEEESIFTPKTIAQNIYEEYSEKFHSLKQVEFIEHLLRNEENKLHSYIVSLFFFFKKDLKIKTPSAKLFQKIINSEFNLTIGGIKLSDSTNLEHLKRMKSIKKVWTKFH